MLAYFYSKKCQEKLKENAAYFMAIIADPGSLVKFNASGALVEAAKGGMDGLAQFAGDYIDQNSDALILSALKATGLENTFAEAYKLCMNFMAAAIMGQNNLVLKMAQELSFSIMGEIVKKDEKLYEITEHVKELYMILASLVSTEPEWDAYYDKLRQALSLVEGTVSDLKIVSSTYKATNRWLSKKYDGTVTKLEQARDLITPKENNPAISRLSEGSYKIQSALKTGAPDKTKSEDDAKAQTKAKGDMISAGLKTMRSGLAFFGAGLADTFPFPTTEQKWQAFAALNKVSGKLTKSLQGYFELTARVDMMIAGFLSCVGDIQVSVNDIFKNYILGLLEANMNRISDLSDSMAFTLNGDAEAKGGPISDAKSVNGRYMPNSLVVSSMSFKWIMDINLIFHSYKLIPTNQLSALNLSQEALDLYNSTVDTLKSMGDRRSGLAVMRMKEAQEETADLETQVLALVLEANQAAINGNVKRGILSLCRTVLSRLELSYVTDHQIYTMMEKFYYTPMPDIKSLDNTYGSLTDNFKKAGLDRAAACLVTGDFKTLFGMQGKSASYVGAALGALAVLKKCLGKNFNWKLLDAQAELESALDLLNIEFSINFDLAILKNLQDCLKLVNLAGLFNPQEIICAVARDIAAGGTTETSNLFKRVDDIFNKTPD